MIPVVGELVTSVLALLQYVYNIISEFVKGLFTNFPLDNERKTLYLSIIMLFITYLLIYGVVERTGVGEADGVQSPGGFNMSDDGEGETTNPVGINDTLPYSGCTSDDDCALIEIYKGEEVRIGNGICCYADEFSGYYCAGRCLVYTSDPAFRQDHCRLPTSCETGDTAYTPENYPDIYIKDPGYCIGQATNNPRLYGSDDEFCASRGGEHLEGESRCCDQLGQVCYGYCTKPGGTCGLGDTCFHQNEITIKNLEAKYI